MKKNYIIAVIFAVCFSSCNDAFLDRSPQDLYDHTFWNNVNDLKTYVNSFYGALPEGLSSLDDSNSDNQVPNNVSEFIWGHYALPAEGGGWGKDDWKNIRNVNYFLSRYNQAKGDEKEINKYVAEAKFFRAFFYIEKLYKFGDIPWVTTDLTPDSEELYGKKEKRNIVARNIVEDLNFAIEWLPEEAEAGRISRNAARHLKARLCLNEGTYYKYHTELGYGQDVDFFLTEAVKASKNVMDSKLCEIYNTGAPDKDYYDLFVIEDKTKVKEIILGVDYEPSIRQHGISRYLAEAENGFSKDFVDSYLCIDGKPISISDKYEGDGTMKKESANRDPRFKQNILTNDFPSFISYDGVPTYIENESDFISRYCYTGYKSIKFFIPTAKAFEALGNTYDGIIYRYAETLLIYAEAKAELGTITQDDLDNSINLLRRRVGMPDLKCDVGFTDPDWPDWGYTLSPILQEIRRERRVELVGEGLRFDDLRRWKAGHLLNNVMTYVGKKTDAKHYAVVYPNYTTDDYTYKEGVSRKWNDKLYLYPIPTGELGRNPNLLPQNPGW